MKWQLLCSFHQTWLEGNPNLAKSTSLECIDRALELAGEGELLQAIKFAGSGFEAALMVVLHLSSSIGNSAAICAGSAILLGRLFYRTNQDSLGRSVIARAGSHREALLVLGNLRREVFSCCQRVAITAVSSASCRFAMGSKDRNDDRVQLELSVDVLRRLIREKDIFLTEIRCLNDKSSDACQAALKLSLTS